MVEFGGLDDFVIRNVCRFLLKKQQLRELAVLTRSNKRIRELCQPIIDGFIKHGGRDPINLEIPFTWTLGEDVDWNQTPIDPDTLVLLGDLPYIFQIYSNDNRRFVVHGPISWRDLVEIYNRLWMWSAEIFRLHYDRPLKPTEEVLGIFRASLRSIFQKDHLPKKAKLYLISYVPKSFPHGKFEHHVFEGNGNKSDSDDDSDGSSSSISSSSSTSSSGSSSSSSSTS